MPSTWSFLSSYDPNNFFIFDCAGDKNNRIFDTTHYSIKSEYRTATKTPLGSTGRSHRTKRDRYFRKHCRKFVQENGDLTFAKVEAFGVTPCDVYLSVNLPYEYVHSGIFPREGDVEHMHRKLSCEPHEEKDYWMRKASTYHTEVSDNPSCIDSWLRLVDIQDRTFKVCFDTEKTPKKGKGIRALVERKLSILDSAIKKNASSLTLYLKKLHLGSQIWEGSELKDELQKVLRKFPHSREVCFAYLHFQMDAFSIFSLTDVTDCYPRCVGCLLSEASDPFVSETVIVDFTFDLAQTWKQGGLMERSVALFQAMLEFNLHPLNAELDAALSLLEVFWDSRAPRIGEEGSVGWIKVLERKELVHFQENIIGGTQTEEDKVISDSIPLHRRWVKVEQLREKQHWLPWQQDPDECEDEERMVQFKDIRCHLRRCHSELGRFLLVKVFLEFLGVRMPQEVTLLCLECIHHSVDYRRLETFDVLMHSRDAHNQQHKMKCLYPSVCDESDMLFDFIIRTISHVLPLISDKLRPLLAIVMLNIIKERFLYVSAAKSPMDVKTVAKKFKKLAKEVLRRPEFRENVSIFHHYAILEGVLGSESDALNVYCHLLTSRSCSLAQDKEQLHLSLTVLDSFIQMTFKEACISEVKRNILLSGIVSFFEGGFACDGSKCPSALSILKAKKNILDMSESLKLRKCTTLNDVYELLIKLKLAAIGAICQFITGGGGVAIAALHLLCQECCKQLDASSSMDQVVLEEAFLFFFHLANSTHSFVGDGVSPLVIKEALEDAMQYVPLSPVILELWAKKQNWRDHLITSSSRLTGSRKPLQDLFLVQHRISKMESVLGSNNSGALFCGHDIVRHLEHLSENEEGRHCPLVWRLYLKMLSVTRPRDLKAAAHAAVSSCPGVKSIYLDAIDLVPSLLHDFVRLMDEKGLRVRLPLEELNILVDEEEKEELRKIDEEIP